MNTSRASLIERFNTLPKMRRFAAFVGMAAVAAAIISMLIWLTVFRQPPQRPVAIAIVAPMTGPDAAVGQSLRDGAQVWVDHKGRLAKGRSVRIVTFDTVTLPDALQQAAKDPDVVAVLGPQGLADTAASGVPGLPLAGPPATDNGWTFPLSAEPTYEARFLANYVRNVTGEKLVSILMPEGADQEAVANAFDETLQRFGTKVVYKWQVSGRAALDAQAKQIADKQIAGAILVLGDPAFAAEAVAALGAAEVSNRVVGLRDLATNQFLSQLHKAWRGPGALGSALDNTLVTTPLLFDTAGVAAQAFQTFYRSVHHQTPDWVAQLGNDGARVISQALAATNPDAPGGDLREALRTELLKHRSADTALAGLAGPIFFDSREGGSLPTLVGRYDGQDIVAAPTQLTPIRDDGVSNYLEQLQAGKILYVNDRFMYKTNLVPAGIRITKVTNLKTDVNTVDLEFMLWFRWRGDVVPNDIVFDNAVAPITLGNPERSVDDGDQHYRAWRVRGTFFLNYEDVTRQYGSQLVDVTFRHRTLARNNLMYVADVIGMDLKALGDTPKAGSMVARLLNVDTDNGHGSALVDQLTQSKVLAGAPGWLIDQALFSQQLGRSGADGDPSYVGFGKPAPLFSRMSMDVVLVLDELDITTLLPPSILIYLAIFAFSGSILAFLLDRRGSGQFWRMQTLLLRLVCWPALLASFSAMALDYTLLNASLSMANVVDFISRLMWWMVPARLVSLSVQRFIWAPLEIRTQRKVPTVFRILVSIIIYGLSMLGVVAFVMGKTVTSLLATSGLLTFIVGMSLQSSLRDVVSGVMINLERPFGLGDWIRIGRTVGQVSDISWRTTRIRMPGGQIVAFANGRVADSEIENMTPAGAFDASLVLFLDPRCNPDQVVTVLRRAAEKVTKPEFTLSKVVLRGIENEKGAWVAKYEIDMICTSYRDRGKIRSAVWLEVWRELEAAGLIWATMPQTNHLPEDEVAIAAQ